MMIRGLTISALFAVLALPAYAQDSTASTPQDNPQTRQTDEDEDAYRRSQRRRDTGDIFEDIDINPNSSGGGGRLIGCLLYTSPSPRDQRGSRMPSSA